MLEEKIYLDDIEEEAVVLIIDESDSSMCKNKIAEETLNLIKEYNEKVNDNIEEKCKSTYNKRIQKLENDKIIERKNKENSSKRGEKHYMRILPSKKQNIALSHGDWETFSKKNYFCSKIIKSIKDEAHSQVDKKEKINSEETKGQSKDEIKVPEEDKKDWIELKIKTIKSNKNQKSFDVTHNLKEMYNYIKSTDSYVIAFRNKMLMGFLEDEVLDRESLDKKDWLEIMNENIKLEERVPLDEVYQTGNEPHPLDKKHEYYMGLYLFIWENVIDKIDENNTEIFTKERIKPIMKVIFNQYHELSIYRDELENIVKGLFDTYFKNHPIKCEWLEEIVDIYVHRTLDNIQNNRKNSYVSCVWYDIIINHIQRDEDRKHVKYLIKGKINDGVLTGALNKIIIREPYSLVNKKKKN